MNIKTFAAAIGVTLAGIAQAGEPLVLDGTAVDHLSPNGRWAISEEAGCIIIFDLWMDEEYAWDGDGTNTDYSVGIGNPVSNDGIVVGNSSLYGGAMYWDPADDDWHTLPVNLDTSYGNYPRAITADGRRICGSAGMEAFSIDSEGIMQVPIIWDRQEDGTYAEAVFLPHPDKDFTGRTPQYVLATCISDDGKTIVGQIVDWSGMFYHPIMWRESDNGEWSYEIVHPELLAPIDYEFPEFPGEGPAQPSWETYMTEEELEAYTAAMEEYYATGDYSLYPNYRDYMTDEEYEEYLLAYEAYMNQYIIWSAAYTEFADAISDATANAARFQFNSIALSPNGRYMALTDVYSDYFNNIFLASPYLFDLQEGTYKIYNHKDQVTATYVNDDATMLAVSGLQTYLLQAYIAPKGHDFELLYDYVEARDTELAEWMDDYLTHSYTDYMTGEVVTGTYAGQPTGDAELNTLATYVYNFWGGEYAFSSFIYDFSDLASIKTVGTATDELVVKLNADGSITATQPLKSLAIYDLNGRLTWSGEWAQGATTALPGLTKGTYVVKARGLNGSEATVKAFCR
ncbi:MAG: T9SS type A sorting domain-containing protein [Bacteroidales bacterium]|nr:T9SS type A sorting domain-containing protein [Bacteroidales bacterium]